MQLIHRASLLPNGRRTMDPFAIANDKARIDMYGFEEMRSNTSLVGAELIQVCLGANEVILRFHPENIFITVLGRDRLINKNRHFFEKILVNGPPASGFGSKVEKFVVIDHNTACLSLSCGEEIVFEDDSSEFEAVIFNFGSKSFVV